ncbi:hypothetical protein CDL15_Pgr028610 [Punica granatum]|uniref:F-box associated domain-containing protein n=1 Tax=Punica granatum TaxID=22663 RepID=A0A218VX42_PUNGR|nr:hypothetical protein CDL15_Pgr028610 [Punica granatum]PKI41624.1 hypothetical protein CRG98_037985 [Punica granatum]
MSEASQFFFGKGYDISYLNSEFNGKDESVQSRSLQERLVHYLIHRYGMQKFFELNIKTAKYNPEERRREVSLLSLDIATVEFDVVAHFLEPYPNTGSRCGYRLALSGVFYQTCHPTPDIMEVWVLNGFATLVWTRHRVISLLDPYIHFSVRSMQPIATLDGDNKLVMRRRSRTRTQMFVCDVRSSEWKEIVVDFEEIAPLGANEWAEHDQYYILHVNTLICCTK